MAEQDYVRLAAACHCGQPVKLWSGRGRKPKFCEEHRAEPKPSPSTETRECPACRGFFVPNAKGGPEQTFCSLACGRRHRRGSKPRQLWPLACRVCSSAFESFDLGAMYCSSSCKQRAWSNANPARARAWKPKRVQNPFSIYFTGYCCDCGCAVGGRWELKRCQRCTSERQRRASREAVLASNQAKHKAIGKVVCCRGCGCEFCPLYGEKLTMTCPACQPVLKHEMRLAAKARRSKRLRTANRETVVRRKVFERDGWKCKLCGTNTPKQLMGSTQPNAPELDHAMPVSRDGAHTYANTQLLCRSCNGWKGAMTMDEALAAFPARRAQTGAG